MSKSADNAARNGTRTDAGSTPGLNEFFSASEVRVERWRSLHRLTRALAAADEASRGAVYAQVKTALHDLMPLEDLNGYPGPRLMALVAERLNTGDATAVSRLVQKISGALLSNSYRDD